MISRHKQQLKSDLIYLFGFCYGGTSLSGTGPSFSLRNSEKCGIWVGWAVYLIRTESSSCRCFWSYISRHALRSSLRDCGLFRILLQASGKTYYKLGKPLSARRRVALRTSWYLPLGFVLWFSHVSVLWLQIRNVRKTVRQMGCFLLQRRENPAQNGLTSQGAQRQGCSTAG